MYLLMLSIDVYIDVSIDVSIDVFINTQIMLRNLVGLHRYNARSLNYNNIPNVSLRTLSFAQVGSADGAKHHKWSLLSKAK